MEIFGTILAIIILLVPVVAKYIERLLTAAGKQEAARKARSVRTIFEDSVPGKSPSARPSDIIGDEYPEQMPPNGVPSAPVFCPTTTEDTSGGPVRRIVYENVRYEGQDYSSDMPGHGQNSGRPVSSELLEGGYKSVRDIIRDRKAADTGQKKEIGKQPSGESADVREKHLKPDPAKMILYHEIMKTKF